MRNSICMLKSFVEFDLYNFDCVSCMFIISSESDIADIEERQSELVELSSHAPNTPRISLYQKSIESSRIGNLHSPVKIQ